MRCLNRRNRKSFYFSTLHDLARSTAGLMTFREKYSFLTLHPLRLLE